MHLPFPTVPKVAHYTKLKVADILTSADESRMRYYNVVYMNDPEEGKSIAGMPRRPGY